MKTSVKQWLATGGLCVALAAMVPVLTGCVAVALVGGAAAGAGTVAYVKGALQANLDAPLTRCATAANQAVTKLLLKKTSETTGGGKVTIKARDGRDRGITIGLEKLTDNATKIEIRVGTFGDRVYSQRILDEVKRALNGQG